MTPWLSDLEIDDLCQGVRTNAARVRHLQRMGLHVNRKPNGRPLVMRAHAEAVLAGLAQMQAHAANKDQRPQPNREGLVLAFGGKAPA